MDARVHQHRCRRAIIGGDEERETERERESGSLFIARIGRKPEEEEKEGFYGSPLSRFLFFPPLHPLARWFMPSWETDMLRRDTL